MDFTIRHLFKRRCFWCIFADVILIFDKFSSNWGCVSLGSAKLQLLNVLFLLSCNYTVVGRALNAVVSVLDLFFYFLAKE